MRKSVIAQCMRYLGRMHKLVAILFLLILAEPVQAQSDGLLEIDGEIERYLLRQQTAGRLNGAILTHRPLSVAEARIMLESLDVNDPVDRRLRDQYLGHNESYPGASWAQGIWSQAFANGRDLFSWGDSTWAIQAGYVLDMQMGRAFFGTDPQGREYRNVWNFGRGFRFSGHAGSHVYFELNLTENAEQVVYPEFVSGTAPGRPSTRLSEGGAYKWMDTRAIVGFRTSHFDLRFGRDANLWGPGARSTVLSHQVTTYDQVQIRATLGRFQYVSLLYSPAILDTGESFRPRKYAAAHRITARITDRIELSAFETVVFATDSLGNRARFDLAYANPIIFLRAAERDRGSPDNALLGIGASWRPIDGIKVYGEFLLDEFSAQERGKAWWANKWAWQMGGHVVPDFFPRSELRMEIARMRPFLYAHKETFNSYTHFGDVLGHPSGPNAWNLFVEGSWLASRRLVLTAVLDWTKQGVNTEENLGSDPNLSYSSRAREYGNTFLQGNVTDTRLLSGMASFEVLPAIYLDGGLSLYSRTRDLGSDQSFVLPRVGIRWHATRTHYSR